MLSQIALKNLKEKKLRTFLASISIAIGTASLIVFLGLSNGIKNATFAELEKISPLTQITVRPEINKNSVFSFFSKSLSEENIKQISEIPGVKEVHPEILFNSFSSAETTVLGMDLMTDTMIVGVPENFIKPELSAKIDWNKKTEPYPVIIPRKILDIYNFTIAIPQNLPKITEESLIGKEITLYPNYSTFFPLNNNTDETVKLEVAGFSEKVNMISLTLSSDVIKNLNEKYAKEKKGKILELFVETTDASKTTEVANKIENLGFNTQYTQKNLKDVDAKFTELNMALGIISLIILTTSAIAIISTFLATIAERKKEIGLFRALGATKFHIKKIILFEAGIIGLIGSITGVITGLITSQIINHIALKELAKTTFSPETLFIIDPFLITQTIFFGILLSLLSAYIPAHQASNINPIEALK